MIQALTIAYLNEQDLAIEQRVTHNWSPAIQTARDEEAAIQAAYEAGDITATQWIAGLRVARQKVSEAVSGRDEQLSRLTGTNINKLSGSDAQERWEKLNLSQKRAALNELYEAFVIKPGVQGCPIFKPDRVEVAWKVASQA